MARLDVSADRLSMSDPQKDGGERPSVFIIDDDEQVCLALSSLFRSVGLNVRIFTSAADLLATKFPDSPNCMVVDIRLPGLSGLELQVKLAENNIYSPIIIMTGFGDIPMTVQAMKAGAIDFLAKPFRDQDMLDAVARAIAIDEKRRLIEQSLASVRKRYECLSPREREIMKFVTDGLMNKQIAAEVGLQEITVKVHRGQVMRKMAARSVPELVRMAEALQKSS